MCSSDLIVLEEEKKRMIFDQSRITSLPPEGQIIFRNALNFLQEKIDKSKGRVILTLKKLKDFRDSKEDILIENKDTLHIPEVPSTIQVVGGVQHPTSVVFVPWKNLNYYIDQCGSFTEFADKSRIYVLKANGSINLKPGKVERGDTIYVAEKINIPTDWLKVFTDVSTLLYNFVTSAKIVGIIN